MALSSSAVYVGLAPMSLVSSFVKASNKVKIFDGERWRFHGSHRQKHCSHKQRSSRLTSSLYGKSDFMGYTHLIERRQVLILSIGILVGPFWDASTSRDRISKASEFADMPALRGKDYGKTKMRYPDYTETESGLQYKDLRVGNGPSPKTGEIVVVDWDGYTIGYYGRIFEARNKTKGGSFEGDEKDFFKFKIGAEEVIPAFEEAVKGMSLGGIRSDAG